jgi:myosin heavy subunit
MAQLSPRGSIIIEAKLLRGGSRTSINSQNLVVRSSVSNASLSLPPAGACAADSVADTFSGEALIDSVGTRDLALLAQLSEDAIVNELALRYRSNLIYTNVGDILIAVNPYKELPDLYG